LVAGVRDVLEARSEPGVTFETPGLLLALLLIPIVVGMYVLAQKRRARHPVHFSNFAVLADAARVNNLWRRHIPAALLLVALGALLLGAARPHAQVRVPRGEATVVLVLDVSGSMRAQDVDPTRLAAAQNAARTFVDVLPEDFQVGVVSFSDAAEVLAQPSIDRELIERALGSLVADGGTAIGDALVEALILLSDGYQTAGGVQPLEAAAQADRQGLPVFTVALGTPEGVVEVPGPGGFPQIQRVPPDPETLQAIAEATDGEFFEAPTEDDLRSIYEDLGRRIGYTTERREVTAAFAGAGFVLATAGVGLASVWGRRFP
jgi:Ca-activated chloride channel family protein